MPEKMRRTDIDFPYAIRSFIGYLEGTQKSIHTIKNYQLDISSFQKFIIQQYDGSPIRLDQLSRVDLESYIEHLKTKGFKTNTRRRKILTVTQFLNYLSKRKKLAPEMGQKIAAPHKIERIPYTVSALELIESIQSLGEDSLLDTRNKTLLWTLAESGCLVSEVTDVRFDQCDLNPGAETAFLTLGKKTTRKVPVSTHLFEMIQRLKARAKESPWLFLGFNKVGSLGFPITSRGVEMLVKHLGPKLGFHQLTPRTFRHSVILKWFTEGIPQAEIQARLGLKTAYAFRSYELLFKSNAETTSNPDMKQPEF